MPIATADDPKRDQVRERLSSNPRFCGHAHYRPKSRTCCGGHPMTELLYGLFYLGVLALIVGCFAYLIVTRLRRVEYEPLLSPSEQRRAGRARDCESRPPSRAAVKRAGELSGSYRLSELERILEQLGAIEAWGMVLELKFMSLGEDIQMVVKRNEVELCTPSLDAGYTERFRRAASEAGLQARSGYTEGQYCVDVTGAWARIASIIKRISRSIYGVGESEEVEVRIFT
jgi:hypothetical protein